MSEPLQEKSRETVESLLGSQSIGEKPTEENIPINDNDKRETVASLLGADTGGDVGSGETVETVESLLGPLDEESASVKGIVTSRYPKESDQFSLANRFLDRTINSKDFWSIGGRKVMRMTLNPKNELRKYTTEFQKYIQFLPDDKRELLRKRLGSAKNELPSELITSLAYTMRDDVTPYVSQKDAESYHYDGSYVGGLREADETVGRESLPGMAVKALYQPWSFLAPGKIDQLTEDLKNLGVVPVNTKSEQIRSAMGVEEDLSGFLGHQTIELPTFMAEMALTRKAMQAGAMPAGSEVSLAPIAKTSSFMVKSAKWVAKLLESGVKEGATVAASQALFKGQVGEEQMRENLKMGAAFGVGSAIWNNTFMLKYFDALRKMPNMNARLANAVAKVSGDAIVGTVISAGLQDPDLTNISGKDWMKHTLPQLALSIMHIPGSKKVFADQMIKTGLERGAFSKDEAPYIHMALTEMAKPEALDKIIRDTRESIEGMAKAKTMFEMAKAEVDPSSDYPLKEINDVAKQSNSDDVPMTFKQFVESKNVAWPIKSTDINYLAMSKAYEEYKIEYNKGGGKVAEEKTQQNQQKTEGTEVGKTGNETGLLKPTEESGVGKSSPDLSKVYEILRDKPQSEWGQKEIVETEKAKGDIDFAKKLLTEYESLGGSGRPLLTNEDMVINARQNRYSSFIEESLGMPITQKEKFALAAKDRIQQLEAERDSKLPSDVVKNLPTDVPPPGQESVGGTGETGETGEAGGKQRLRGWVQTLRGAKETSKNLDAELADLEQYYEQLSSKERVVAVDREIKGNTKATDDEVMAVQLPSVDTAIKGARLIRHYDEIGDHDAARRVADHMDNQFREAGRFIQAATVYGHIGSRYLMKEIKRIYEKYRKEDLPKDLKDTVEKRLEEADAIDDPVERMEKTTEVLNYVADNIPLTVGEKLDAFRYENMLSNPLTSLRNISTNTLVSWMVHPAVVATKGFVNAFRSGNDGFAKSIMVGMGEGGKAYSDMVHGLRTSMKAAADAFMTGSFESKFDDAREMDKSRIGEAIQGRRQANVPVPFRFFRSLMEAQDALFRSQIAIAEKNRLIAEGAKEGEANVKAWSLANKLLGRQEFDSKDPTRLYVVRTLDWLGEGLNKIRNADLGVVRYPAKFMVPFLKFPVNQAKLNYEFSPFASVEMGVKSAYTNMRYRSTVRNAEALLDMALESGSKSDIEKAQRHLDASRNKIATFDSYDIAKSVLGSLVMGLGAWKAIDNETEWLAPEDEDAKKLFYASGRRPFSVKIPGIGWTPFYYLGPFALAFAFPAALKYYTVDRKEALADSDEESVMEGIMGIGRYIVDSTPMQAFGDLNDIYHGKGNWQKLVGRSTTQMLPLSGMMSYIARWVDPVYRKKDSFLDVWKATIPGMSKDLKAYKDPYGRDAKRPTSSLFIPWPIGEDDPSTGELLEYYRESARQSFKENKEIRESEDKLSD